MITNIIVISSLVFAAAFFLVWLLRSDLREQIERPKYRFQDQLRDYDQQCEHAGSKEDSPHA